MKEMVKAGMRYERTNDGWTIKRLCHGEIGCVYGISGARRGEHWDWVATYHRMGYDYYNTVTDRKADSEDTKIFNELRLGEIREIVRGA